MLEKYAAFKTLAFDRPAEHVLRVTLNRPEKMNALGQESHDELIAVWGVIDADPETRVTIVTGAGRAFSAGGDMDYIDNLAGDHAAQFQRDFHGGRALVRSIIDARKPIVSAINGAAMGAGLALALLADIPIAAKTAKLLDGHTRIGVAAGDHAALIWPLLCGIAKAKYFLMTNTVMTGEDAERNNLVALAVDLDKLEETSIAVATNLANTAPSALAMTKYVLNHWLRQAQPIFDLSLAVELAALNGGEANEALAAFLGKRAPKFD